MIVRHRHRIPREFPLHLDSRLCIRCVSNWEASIPVVIVRNLSCPEDKLVHEHDTLNRILPAVSQICSLIFFPSISIVRILKSMPIVVMKDGVNWSSLNRRRRHDLPTPKHTAASVCEPKSHRPDPGGQCNVKKGGESCYRYLRSKAV